MFFSDCGYVYFIFFVNNVEDKKLYLYFKTGPLSIAFGDSSSTPIPVSS
jgi:hypothetical protein